jgi:hypothetical protein
LGGSATAGDLERAISIATPPGGPSSGFAKRTQADMKAFVCPPRREGRNVKMQRYVARLCWNTAGWVRPTGEARETESDTYATRMGFGHEEWLFNYQWMLEGWKYGFLQPVNRSYRKVQGSTIDVRLYTISPDGVWYYVAHVRHCEVLTQPQAEAAREEFRTRGWLADMEEHVEAIGGDVEGLRYEEPTSIFNVRFRQREAEIYNPKRLVDDDDAVRSLKRYTLTEITAERESVVRDWNRRVGRAGPKSAVARIRKAVAATVIDPVHDQLQDHLRELLSRRYGAKAVEMERDFCDLCVRQTAGVILIEVKSDGRPRRAIRDAIGQLLEYAYRSKSDGERVTQLVVAAPGELGEADRAFLAHLREERGLPLSYLRIGRDVEQVDLNF